MFLSWLHPELEASVEEPPRPMESWYATFVFACAAPAARLRLPNTAQIKQKRLMPPPLFTCRTRVNATISAAKAVSRCCERCLGACGSNLAQEPSPGHAGHAAAKSRACMQTHPVPWPWHLTAVAGTDAPDAQ